MPEKSIPTPNELTVLRLLWKQGPLTVRQIRDLLRPGRNLAYTTVLTIANILVRKGWLDRRRQGRADWFFPAEPEPVAKARILRQLADQMFDHSLDDLRRFVLEIPDLPAGPGPRPSGSENRPNSTRADRANPTPLDVDLL